MNKLSLYIILCAAATLHASGAEPVAVGNGSYSYGPPAYKSASAEHGGFRGHDTEGRKLYITPEADRTPLPSNDWWTDLMISQFSGALWSYPQMLYTSADGVTVHYPSYWQDNGEELRSRSRLLVGGADFRAEAALAAGWHDWDVEMRLPSASGNAALNVTMVHGMPFTWFECEGLWPEVSFSDTPQIFGSDAGHVGVNVAGDLYGLYFDKGAKILFSDGRLTAEGSSWLTVALLKSESDLEVLDQYACSAVRATTLEWNYDERTATLTTRWSVEAENLRTPGGSTSVMQGFLPHVYKHMTSSDLNFCANSYLTPRGIMKSAVSNDGVFEYSYRFPGITPYWAAPETDDDTDHPFRPELMRELMQNYAENGTFGGDTYWGGKGLLQMALNMEFAKECGENELYELSRSKLRETLENWLTYTPGEDMFFFSYFPRWGSMVGYDVSYDSDAFNDHHFHYGYMIYAAALLCLEDDNFRNGYGDILTMIAKDYANYDRADSRFPFLRTMDPWVGHSYAGGFGDHGNDNGNGQESSSESMQSWGALYMLGIALGDTRMRDAGIFGWITESLAVREYWFDVDHIYPDRDHNYDYTKYTRPYNSNITCKGIGWWTWFSGDPIWMHSIQWMPVSPLLSYLSRDLEFARWDYETMMTGTENSSWWERNGDNDALANQSLGNVVLCYLERSDPQQAASIFDTAAERDMGIARNADTGHISYYAIHSHLTHGDLDFSVYSDCPTATAHRHDDGSMTYCIYNPGTSQRTVNFYRDGARITSVEAPAKTMTAYSAQAEATQIAIESKNGLILPPSATSILSAKVLDQYGASMSGKQCTWILDENAPAEIDGEGNLAILVDAGLGTKFSVSAACGELTGTVTFEVNLTPVATEIHLNNVPAYCEAGTELNISASAADQYGSPLEDTAISILSPDGERISGNGGTLRFRTSHPGKYTAEAKAGDITDIRTFVVTPSLPNLATGKTATASSYENAGTIPANVNDGDHSTRWGSNHTDNEWIYIDLGEPCFVARTVIDWETAYAAAYEIEASDSPDDESSWRTVKSISGRSSAGIDEQQLGVECSGIRIRGVRRGSAYGYSIHELEIHGFALSTPHDRIIGIDIDAPAVMDEGSETELNATGYTLDGEARHVGCVWSADGEASFNGNMFTPLGYGMYTVSAVSGDMSGETHIFVDESIKLSSVEFSPEEISIIEGESARIEMTGRNQFGGVHPCTDIDISLTDDDGNTVDYQKAVYDPETEVFTGYEAGDYILLAAGAQCKIKVQVFSDANLALGKRATATSALGGNTADLINDGNTDTRWESRWQEDNAAVTINLGDAYVINRMEILWEGAYASEYELTGSLDGENWTQLYSATATSAGLHSFSFSPEPARYVQLVCKSRALEAYGCSVYEWRVFGLSQYAATTETGAPVICDSPVDVYTPVGVCLRRGVPAATATDGLLPGIYIVGSRKIIVK